MRRREFITLLGGAVATWPISAHAQQSEQLRRVGVLVLGNAYDQSFGTELREGLRNSGYIEGKDIEYVFRSADGNIALVPKYAAELVALKVDVIIAVFTPPSLAAQRATREIPIVTVSGDPVALGLVTSLARPGGNITGMSLITAELLGKCVELFRDALPGIRTVAALGNTSDPFSKPFLDEVRSVGKATGIKTPEVMVSTIDEVDSALASMKKDGADAVIVQGSLATQHVANLLLNHRLPAASFARSFVEVGGLMSYGPNVADVFRHSAGFVAKVLQGRKPEDLPVERPTKIELVINLKTARAFELKIAESFLLRATELIE